MKQFYFLIPFLYFTLISFGQETKADSLQKHLITVSKKNEKLETYLQLIINHQDQISDSLNLEYLNNALLLSKDLKNSRYESITYGYYASRHRYMRNKDSALYYVRKAKSISLKTKDYLQYLDDVNLEAIIYSEFNEVNKAILLCKNTLKLIKKEKIDNQGVSRIYVRIGSGYFMQENETEALDYYIKAINYAEKHNQASVKLEALRGLTWINIDNKNYRKAKKYAFEGLITASSKEMKYEEASMYRILGTLYNKTKQYDSAFIVQKKSLLYFDNIDNIYMQFDLNNQIAYTLTESGEFNKSLDYASKALSFAEKTKDTSLIISSNISIAESSLGLKDYNKSLEILTKSKILSDKLKDFPSYTKVYLLDALYRAHNSNGDYKNSLVFLEKLKSHNDSVNEQKLTNKVLSIETKYQTEKKEKENLDLIAEKAAQETLITQQSKRTWQLSVALVIALLGLGIIYYYFRRNQKQKNEIETQKNKIENLQKELHHRLKNNLAFIDMFISLAKGKFTDIGYQEKLTELQNRISSMFEVHEQLFQKKNITSINPNTYISKLANNVKKAYDKPNIKIVQNINTTEEFDSQTSFPMGIIINEFVTNSYKYAFNKDQQGEIKIALDDTDDDFQLTLSDNGKGLPQGFNLDSIETFGLDSIKLLTQEYKGTFSLDGNDGVVLKITLPKQAA